YLFGGYAKNPIHDFRIFPRRGNFATEPARVPGRGTPHGPWRSQAAGGGQHDAVRRATRHPTSHGAPRVAQPPEPAGLSGLARPGLPSDPAPGADRTPAVAHGRLWGTKPLCASRRHKERLTRRLGTALDGPLRSDLEEMPVDHGQEGLKLAAA